jgi:hypothetical protein
MALNVWHTDEIAESSCSAKIVQLQGPRPFGKMLLLSGGDRQIEAQRRDGSISQKHEFEREALAKDVRPAQKATIDHNRRSNRSDSSTTTCRRKAFHFPAPQLELIAQEHCTGAQGHCSFCSEMKDCLGHSLAPSAPTTLGQPCS